MANTIGNLSVLIGANADKLHEALEDSGKELGEWTSKVTGLIGGLSFVGMASAATEAAETIEEGMNQIIQRTGATGQALEGLGEDFRNVYASSEYSASQIASTLSLLSVRTGTTGAALEELTRSSLEFAKATGSDVNSSVQVTQDIFALWGITTEQQSAAMDVLTVASQRSGKEFSVLGPTILSVTPLLYGMGYNFEQTAALVANFAKHGLNAAEIMGSLKRAMVAWGEAGQDPQAMLTSLIQKMTEAKSYQEALTLATHAHIRGAAELTTAVRVGAFAVGDMTAALDASAGATAKTAGQVHSLSESWSKLQHTVSLGMGGDGLGTLASGMEKLIDRAASLVGWLQKINPANPANLARLFAGPATAPELPEPKPNIPPASLGNQPGAGGTGQTGEALAGVTDKYKAMVDSFSLGSQVIHLQWENIQKDIHNTAELIVSLQKPHLMGPLDVNALIPVPPVLDAIGASIKTAGQASDTASGALQKMGIDLTAIGGPMEELASAAQYLGITTRSQFQDIAEKSKESYDKMKASGLATASELEQAFLKYELAQIDYDHAVGVVDDALYVQRKKNAEEALKEATGEAAGMLAVKDITKQVESATNSLFDSLEKGFVKDIETGKGWGRTITDVGKKAATDVADTFLKQLFEPLEKRFAAMIVNWVTQMGGKGGILGTLFGGAPAAAAGGAASGGAAAAGTAANTVAVTASTTATTLDATATTANTAGDLANTSALFANTAALVAGLAASTTNEALAVVTSVIHFAGGGNVPSDMLAHLHAGEMVLPAGLANFVRSAAAIAGAPGGASVAAGAGGLIIQGNFSGIARETVDVLAGAIIRKARLSGMTTPLRS